MSTTGFIAGASGYTGRGLVRALRDEGHGAIAHIRPGSRMLATLRPEFEGLGARVDTTPWELEAMTATLRAHAPTIVFALLGTTRERAKKEAGGGAKADYEGIDYGLTSLLLRACIASGVRPRFVYLSSLGASASSPSEYLRVRGRIEDELRASGLEWLSIRPSFITGDRDEPRIGETIGARVVDGALGLAGLLGARTLHDRYHSLTGAELARGMLALAVEDPHTSRVVPTEGVLSAIRARYRW